MRNQSVLLTGGTGDLGTGIMPLVLASGASPITIPYTQLAKVEHLKRSLTPAELARIRFVDTDLRNEAQVETLINSMSAVEILIHLVGGFDMGKTDTYSLEQWQHQINLNLTTTFLVCKHCLRRMKERNYGRIVTIGSSAAIHPTGQKAAYAAAKAGVIALTQTIAAETKGTAITANVVLPSTIDTAKNRQAMGEDQAHNWVTPRSLGEIICFLASPAAQDIRGAVIPVFGNS